MDAENAISAMQEIAESISDARLAEVPLSEPKITETRALKKSPAVPI